MSSDGPPPRVRDCTCPRVHHPHGTRDCYRDGCRCIPCRNANSTSERERRRRHAYQRWAGIPVWVDPTGPVRRLQALQAVGWSTQEIARRLGVDRSCIGEYSNATRMEPETAERIRRIYDELWDKRPTGRYQTRVIRHARRNGYAPPLAWDDETIDDPEAVPDLGAKPRAGVSVESIEWLAESGLSAPLIAARLGVTMSALEHACRRENRIDVWLSLTGRVRYSKKEQAS